MKIQCPECGAGYRIKPGGTEKRTARVKCPRCAHVFRINLGGKTAEPSPEVSIPSSSGGGPAGRKILVVDDSRFFRELIVEVLTPLEVSFLTAGDGIEALEIIRRESPDLVLLDLNLPLKDGYELIREIRADSSLSSVRLMAMSGFFRKQEDVEKASQSGADDFISKTFKPEQLRERVMKLLENARPRKP